MKERVSSSHVTPHYLLLDTSLEFGLRACASLHDHLMQVLRKTLLLLLILFLHLGILLLQGGNEGCKLGAFRDLKLNYLGARSLFSGCSLLRSSDLFSVLSCNI